jgi:hypothetical protein
MAGGITAEQAIDLGYATLQAYEPNAVQMALKKTTYEVVNRWFPKAHKLSGGKRVDFDLSLGDTGNGMFKKMYGTDTPNVANVVKEGTVAWVDYQNSFSYAIQELEVNRDNKTRIFDLLRNRKLNCARETADELELAGWITPESATDTDKPHGIAGWIVPGTSDSNGAFYGYLPHYTTSDDASSTYSTIAGLSCSSTVNNLYANWYADHNGNLDDSLLKLLRLGSRLLWLQTRPLTLNLISITSDFTRIARSSMSSRKLQRSRTMPLGRTWASMRVRPRSRRFRSFISTSLTPTGRMFAAATPFTVLTTTIFIPLFFRV